MLAKFTCAIVAIALLWALPRPALASCPTCEVDTARTTMYVAQGIDVLVTQIARNERPQVERNYFMRWAWHGGAPEAIAAYGAFDALGGAIMRRWAPGWKLGTSYVQAGLNGQGIVFSMKTNGIRL